MATSNSGTTTHGRPAANPAPRRSRRTRGLAHGLAAAAALLAACTPPPPPDTFLTRAERTDYRETSSYLDVVAFLEHAAAASPLVHYTTYGYTTEGRALPLAVVGDIEDPSPASVRATGKTVVYLQGNIHAGEVCGKEALQMLLRDLLAGRHGEWRESMVLLIAPIYNADGNERVTLTNRGRQHGPIGGMGQRPNAQGYDLNRDHMKIESPEARSVARLFSQYDPHVAVDLHTTNGTQHAYHLTYSPPLHPNTPPRHRRLPARWPPPPRHQRGPGQARLGILLLRQRVRARRRRARLVHLRPPPPVQQQLHRSAQPDRDPERGLFLRVVRGARARDAVLCRGDSGLRA